MTRLFLILLLLTLPCSAHALDPDEVMVLANRNAARSKGLAQYYMEKRNIPEENLLLVWVTDRESCSREAYEKKVVPPVRRFLAEDKQNRIRCIVSFYGMPLKIASPGPTEKEQRRKADLEQKTEKLARILENAGEKEKLSIEKQLKQTRQELKRYKRTLDRGSSLDSELSLVQKKEYPLKMWQPNPYFLGFANQQPSIEKSEVLMTARIDGPDSETVKRIIDDTMEAEQNGLTGTACFDARWDLPKKKNVSGYALYDRSIHRAHQKLKTAGGLKMKLNRTSDLFQEGDCPDAALYCGWYSLANYVDAFDWQKGAVGYHIASQECQTLKSENTNVWCKKMIDDGIAATIGPVGEPYVQSFPMPEIFFPYLAEGTLTLAESYLISLPYLSWKMVLVGDPLYRVNISDGK